MAPTVASTPASAATIVERRVAASSDDAEEASGSVDLTSSDLELIQDSADAQTVGLRWTSVAIPRNAVITAAYVQFVAKESQSEATTLTIRGQAADNAATFGSSVFSSRTRTSAAVTWSPAAWSAGGAGASQRTADLRTVLQEIVNRTGWASGNAIAIIVSGTGHRTAYSYDGSPGQAPLLHVEYNVTPPPDAPPLAALTVTPSGLTVVADGSGSTDTDATPIGSYRFTFGDATAAVTTTAPTASVPHTYSAAGTYTVTLIATDTAGNASSPVSRSVTVPAALATTFERRVGAGSDDAEEASGSVDLASSDLELVQDGLSVQTVGMRWTSVAIPRNAVITAASIQFVARESRSEATSLTLRAQASDNAPAFTATSLNLSSRARTTASRAWSPVAWNAGEAGANQRTPDLAAVIQEVVNRSGWASGNAIAIIVSGTGHRTAYSYEGSPTATPLLHVEYRVGTSSPPPDAPPLAALTVTPSGLTVVADGSGSTDTDATPIASYRFTFGDGTAAVTTTAPIASASHTYAAAGTYTVALIATDTAGNASASVSRSVTVSAPLPTTFERRVVASSDDAEETSGSVSLTSGDLELVQDGSSVQTVGLRWTSVAIPRNAVITTAYVQFAAKMSQSEATTLTIRGQATDNATTFGSSAFSSRTRTSAAVTWSPAAWSAGGAGASQRTSDLRTVLQEIVNRSGWTSGNAIALIVNGSGSRTAYSYDGSSGQAPLLHVEYTGGTSSSPPPGPTDPNGVAVYAGYYSTHHPDNPRPKPTPWKGSSNTIFVGTPDPGTSNEWDTSAIRIDNLGSSSLTGVSVVVDIGSNRFALWSSQTIPAGSRAIFAQTNFENFDGSDTNPAGCYDCDPNDCLTKVVSTKPVVRVTMAGTTTNYIDANQTLNTEGVDAAGCPYTGGRNDESRSWRQIFPAGAGPAAAASDEPSSTDAASGLSERGPQLSWVAKPFPNPSHGQLEVMFRLATIGHVRVAIYDVAGRKKRDVTDIDLDPGDYLQQINLSGLGAGMYYFRITSPQVTLQQPFVLIR